MFVKNELDYKIIKVDDNENQFVAIKQKTKKHEYTLIVVHFCQWRMPGKNKPNDNHGIKRQKARFNKFADTIDKLRNGSDNLLLIGDYNNDLWQENELWLWTELKALQPILDRIMLPNGLKCVNHKPTHHSANKRSSLIDLVLTTDPEALSNVKNIKTGLSDHDGLLCWINFHDIQIKPQFYISIEFRKINAANIIAMIDENESLQSFIYYQDPDKIASKLNEGLNEIAKK